MNTRCLWLLLAAVTLGANPALSQVPDSISFQGYLEDGGLPVNNASATLTFRLYDVPAAGTALWTETQSGVSIAGGLFSVYLGHVQTLKNVPFTEARWLSTAIGDDTADELSPRTLLAAAPYAFSLRGLRVRPSTAYEYAPALIGGYWKNSITAGVNSATISGGGNFFYPNHVGANGGTVGGGEGNTANGVHTTVGGGLFNYVLGPMGTVAGGYTNSATQEGGTVGGGESNKAQGKWSTVGGGYRNRAAGDYSVAAGYNAKALHQGTFVFNGDPQDLVNHYDSLATTANGQFLVRAPGGVGIGTNNPSSPLTVNGRIESKTNGFKFPDGSVQITANVSGSGWGLAGNAGTTAGTHFVGTTDDEPLEIRVNNNRALRIESTDIGYEYGAVNMIGGASSNSVFAGAVGATISGGGSSETGELNKVLDHYGVIGGGYANVAGLTSGSPTDADAATVGGGAFNTASAALAVVAGGGVNTASGFASFVGAGNTNQATDSLSTIGGGRNNTVQAPFGTIGGGGSYDASRGNLVTDSYGTVGGGFDNQSGDNAGNERDAMYATVSGGRSNVAKKDYSSVGGGFSNQANGPVSTVAGGWSNHADGERAAIGGGRDNRAGGYAATVPGGSGNYATGSYSFAAGRNAVSTNQGCFTWADNSTTTSLTCNTDNRWAARAAGGVYFYTNSAMTTGVYAAANGGSWNNLSDRSQKTAFEPIDQRALLDRIGSIDVSSWQYASQDGRIRHVGPSAQDFNRLLPFLGGEGEEYINTLDADGVALAAIQGLYDLVLEQKAEILALKKELANLKADVGAGE